MYVTNIHQFAKQPETDFKIEFRPSKIEGLSFYEASVRTAKQLANKYDDLHLALSGGMDSEYVLHIFYENGINVKPVIFKSKITGFETNYAIQFCKKRNIKYELVELSVETHVRFIYDKIRMSIKGNGIYTAPVLYLIEKYKKPFITGYGDPFKVTNPFDTMSEELELMEWDFYTDLYENQPAPFFCQNTEIFASLIREIEYDLPLQEAKSRLYGIDWRPKFTSEHGPYHHSLSQMKRYARNSSYRINEKIFW